MKQLLPFLIAISFAVSVTAQDRNIARGAAPGEFYIGCGWYGTFVVNPFYDTLRLALFRFTENGKKLTIQYDSDYFADNSVMQPSKINADATPGVLYCRNYYGKSDGYLYSALYASFDYGKNWTFREEVSGQCPYYLANFEGLIYRIGGLAEYNFFVSDDYGENFIKLYDTPKFIMEPYFEKCEFFAIAYTTKSLYHTNDCSGTQNIIPIDEEFVSYSADVFRGGLPGEVYISSTFNDTVPGYRIFKVSFSADTGHTFRHVYVSDPYYYQGPQYSISFMSDREPGVFYIIKFYEIQDTNPDGHHTKFCIDYYRDYGETLVDTYCHDLTKDYPIETCQTTTDLSAEVLGGNSVFLTWTKPDDELPVAGYRLYRNHHLLTKELLTDTFYLDENLPAGDYKYHLLTHYEGGCISEISNTATVTVVVGITDIGGMKGGIVVYPNPTTGMINVQCLMINVQNIEIFDLMGRKHEGAKAESRKTSPNPSKGGGSPFSFGEGQGMRLNISHLPQGMYFVRITTEDNVVVRKVVKK